MDEVRRLARREVLRNQWLTVYDDDISYADGSLGTYTTIEKRDFALGLERRELRVGLGGLGLVLDRLLDRLVDEESRDREEGGEDRHGDRRPHREDWLAPVLSSRVVAALVSLECLAGLHRAAMLERTPAAKCGF